MSVLTEAEGESLQPMADGLVRRYRDAGKAPPKVMYVDRDCCSTHGQAKTAAMFGEWNQLVVRLDVWHFMRRFARLDDFNTRMILAKVNRSIQFCSATA